MTTFIAGISGVTVAGGVGVIIDTNGQLGTVVSSARFKDDDQANGQGERSDPFAANRSPSATSRSLTLTASRSLASWPSRWRR